MGRIGTGWRLAKKSWHVLAADKSLMVFPIVSTVAAIIAAATIMAPATLLSWSQLAVATEETGPPPLLIIGGILTGYVTTTIAIFFNVALVSCASRSLDGDDTTFGEGMSAAWNRIGVIIAWGFVTYTVGLILRAIEERVPMGGKVAVWIAGAAWALATLLVVPVLAFEGLSPFAALKRSATLFKERFGEVAIGRGTIGGAVFLFTFLPAILLMIAGAFLSATTPALGMPFIFVGVLVMIMGGIIGSTLTQVFNTALYRYATTGGEVAGFDIHDFESLQKKK